MDERRARIQEDLRGLISGDVRCDEMFAQLYASDASIFQIRPLGVVRPRNTEDVVACLAYAAEEEIPVHARGAGSGLAGQALGPGLVIDFSRYMRRIIRVDGDTVRVQPGVVLERLNVHLKRRRRMFGPDPATAASTTVGGMIGVNSGGSHWLRYGAVSAHVRSLEIVTVDGSVFEVGSEPMPRGNAQTGASAAELRRRDIVSRLAHLAVENQATIRDHQPRSLVNTAGYALSALYDNGRLHVPRLICGSEGTLALVSEATLSTVPLAENRSVAIFAFASLDHAVRAIAEVLPLGPSACDLMDRRHVSLACDADPRYDVMIPKAAEALLLVESSGENSVESYDSLRAIVYRLVQETKLAIDARQAFDPEEVELLWQMARHVVPNLYRLKGQERAIPFVEDMAVPPAELASFIVELQNSLKRHQVTASLFAHAGQGQLHLRPLLNPSDPEHLARLRRLADELYEAVFRYGGTISGEHGDGLSRSAFLEQQYGPAYRLFRDVKGIFDPRHVLNPGKIVDNNEIDSHRFVRPEEWTGQTAREDLDEPSENDLAAGSPLVDLQLSWSPEEVADAARNCNGCGACRSRASETRMCPIFHVVPGEEASPRAKANFVRAIITGELAPESLLEESTKKVADLCVHCHMCRIECPAAVDVPRMMAEVKGQYVATNGLSQHDWFIAHVDRLSAMASLASPLSNRLIANRAARWVAEKTLGIAQGRKLPKATSQPFMRRARRRRLTRRAGQTAPKVAYFVDTYANYHDPELAEALVAVMQHNGVAFYVPPGQKSSGMPLIATGALDAARDRARHNVSLLAEAVRQGYHIIATEPSAMMCLRREYPMLLDDDEAQTVAENSSEACQFLWQLHRGGKLKLNFRPLHTVLFYHAPCHLKALGTATAGENLLRLIPALRVHTTESGCSGMAGTYGLLRRNYRTSLRAGHHLMSNMRRPEYQVGTTECSACKIQMEQGTQKPTVHPLKTLALAYGLMPQLADRLSTRSTELVVT